MSQTDSRVCGIDTLSSVSGCTHNVDTAVVHINLNIYLFRLRHNGNRGSRGVNPSAGLCFRYTLYPVYAAFVFQLRISALSGNHGLHLFKAADSAFI